MFVDDTFVLMNLENNFLKMYLESFIFTYKSQPSYPFSPESQMVSAQMCPQGWTFHGGHCYYLSTEHKVTWSTANRACRERYSLILKVIHILCQQTWREIEAESMNIHASDWLSVMHNNCLI